jgi:hypothetical protein
MVPNLKQLPNNNKENHSKVFLGDFILESVRGVKKE